MKQLVLTGMATEHVFMNGGGVEAYYLVFNGGEVRIPVPEETAEAVIRELYGKQEEDSSPGFTQEDYDRAKADMVAENNRINNDDDDGVDQI